MGRKLIVLLSVFAFIAALVLAEKPDLNVDATPSGIILDGIDSAQFQDLLDKAETFEFQAEVSRMMKLIINSLYKNKEIFLRELISNASDAIDKIRFLALTKKSVLESKPELDIRVSVDKDNNILHITDSGVGMTKQELINNLGTIAKSGTAEFMQKLQEGADSSLIGQFGVGFYSAFLVADKVVVTSKHNDDKQYIWESNASSFNIVEDPRGNTLGRGTQISLHLKEEASDFLEESTLRDLIKKYSQFISFPIYLYETKTETVEVPDDEATKTDESSESETPEKVDTEDDVVVEDEDQEKDPKKPKTKTIEKVSKEWQHLNKNKPLWTRDPKEVTDEEYTTFYEGLTQSTDKVFTHVHFNAEGEVNFKSILFVPEQAPRDLMQSYGKYERSNIKMFVRRVFITDEFQEIMPSYLHFIKGMVDSDDLPLNVSRETLQQHKLLKVIRKKLVRKVLEMLKKLSEDPEKYQKFITEYGSAIKMGLIEDQSNRSRLAKLLRFPSSSDPTSLISLDTYIERMKEGQTVLYYVSCQGLEECKQSPFAEKLLREGYEVLYLPEPIDEYVVTHLPEYESKRFQSVAKSDFEMGSKGAMKKKAEILETKFKPLLDWFKEKALTDKIEKAVISSRLESTPCTLIASSHGWSGNMERIMRTQVNHKAEDPMSKFYSSQKKTFEINPRHPVIDKLLQRIVADPEDSVAKDLADVLFETAQLRSGFIVEDTKSFAGRIEKMLRISLDIPTDSPLLDDIEVPDDVETEADTSSADDFENTDAEVDLDDVAGMDEKDILKDEL